MEIDPEKLKAAMRYTIQNLKALDSELLAYRIVLQAVRAYLGPDLNLDEALELTRNSESLRQLMDQKYDATTEKFFSRIDQESLSQDLYEWLEKWKPEGPQN